MKHLSTPIFLFRAIMIVLTCISSSHVTGQIITTIVGDGTSGYHGDGGPATAAEINFTRCAVKYYSGDLYLADGGNNVIRKVDAATGIITTIAGSTSGTAGYGGDGGPATAALLSNPMYIDFDGSGNLYFTDNGNSRIRKITPAGIISTIAGTGTGGYSPDGTVATSAQIANPVGIAVSPSGTVYYCNDDNYHAVVRKISGGVISTVAGHDTAGYTGDGVATANKLHNPIGLCIDGSGNLYVVDNLNYRVREITTGGMLITIAGTGITGYTGDGGAATAARLDYPQGVAVDAGGNVFVADFWNNVIRKISSGVITTVAGNGYGYGTSGTMGGFSGDGGPATAAELWEPLAVDVDCAGNLYIPDLRNYRVRMVSGSNSIPYFIAGAAGSLALCPCSGAYSINSLLTAIDSDYSQNLYWTIETPPALGALSGFPYSTTSSGSSITPSGLVYTPPCSAGVDTFQIRIADCAGGASLITVHVTIVTSSSISGTLHTCVGSSSTLSDVVPGGAWSSSNTSIATVGSSTGVVSGLSAGPVTITYSLGSSCYVTAPFTVDATPAAISGSSNVCLGATSTLSDTYGGGIWTSSNTGVATVGSATGVVNSISAGTAIITYTLPTGCFSTLPVTVASLSAISGSHSVCGYMTTALSDAASGGTWTSADPTIASVGSTSGMVAGVTSGTTTITYTLFSGCFTTFSMSVDLPPAISGVTTFCLGDVTTLSDGAPGGTWTSGNTAVATVGSSTGIVSGAGAGTANITYTLPSGCFNFATIAVVAAGPIGGTPTTCVGSTTTLSASGGGTWTSSNTATATVGSSTGVVTGVAAGIVNITYTLPLGCKTSITITVNALPASIGGTLAICEGTSTTLTDATSGGSWSSSSTAVATIGSSTGTVTAGAAGYTTITYTLGTGCFTTAELTVNPLPASITGTTLTCVGGTTTLGDATGGGIWTSSSTGTATIGSTTGLVRGISVGTATITYTLPTGCTATTPLTVVAFPSPISGPSSVCAGSSITLTDAPPGGVWSSSNPPMAGVGLTTGIVTGHTTGSVTITYSLGTGCRVSAPVTVLAIPDPISGGPYVCIGGFDTLSETSTGGTWSSSTPAIGSIGTTGIVAGLSGGVTTVTYTLPNGCFVTHTVNVDTIASITGVHSLCAWGDTLTIHDADTGGLYSSSGVTVGTIGDGYGIVTTYAAGVDTILYVTSAGCRTYTLITVNPLPAPIVAGTYYLCAGSTTTVTDAASGGYWSSAPITVATVGSASGIVTGVATGTARVTYTLPTGCYTDTPIVVNPALTTIGGTGFLCVGSTIRLIDGIPGGLWSSSDTSTASVGLTTGIVTGHATGTAIITYTLCGSFTTTTVTVSALRPIVGFSTVCVGSTDTLTDAESGGTWYSSNPSVGTISSAGVVTGISAGTTVITYTLSSGCTEMLTVNVSTGGVSCTPCAVFGAYSPLGTSGTISSNVGPGHYYISNNVTVTGTDTFNNAIVLIAPGDTIFVDTSALLVLDSSHLFSLCSEWAGMRLKPGRTHSGRLYVTSHSLIEDAMCAVYAPDASTPASGYIVKSEASIFNRNVVGIFIQRYNPATTNYPFLIHNTVITSRNLQDSNPDFPYHWPPTVGVLGGMKDYWNPSDTFLAPFQMNKSTPGLGYSYPMVLCYGGLLPAYGIRLDSVGNNDVDHSIHVGVPIPGHYYDITIGDTTVLGSNENMNLFDNLQYGIYSINSNVTSVNNAFSYMFPVIPSVLPNGGVTSPGGDCIYAAETDDMANENRLRVYTPSSSTYPNRFYGFRLGVECSNMFQVIGQSCYMTNKNFGSTTLPLGNGGFYVKTAKYDTLDISLNTINNVLNGISVMMAYDPTVRIFTSTAMWTFPSQYMGACNISNNQIQAHPDWAATLSGQQVNVGIAYQNPFPYTTGTDLRTIRNDLTINENVIHDAYNGIFVNNYWANYSTHAPYALTNSIYLRRWVLKRLQYGINYTHCYHSYVKYDTVRGSTGSTPLNDSMRAFYSSMNTSMDEGCNKEWQLGRGFEFQLSNPGSQWHDNNLSNNLKGFVLNAGILGPQTYAGHPVMNDQWIGTWGSGDTQTYVYHWPDTATTPLSELTPFWVNNTTTKYPSINAGNPLFSRYSSVSIYTTTATSPECYPVTVFTPLDSIYSLFASQSISYGVNAVSSNWMAQFALWKHIVTDTTIVDSSTTVANFAHLADSMSRFKYITDIEYALNNGDTATANSLLALNIDSMANTVPDSLGQVWMADDTAADFIVRNYQQFYKLYIKYVSGTMSSADSVTIMALAQLCPERNGAVVYQARALYSVIYDDLSVFNDDSCLDIDTTYEVAAKHSHSHTVYNGNEITQGYSLHPNPTNGEIFLQQALPDDQPVKAEIWNVLGVSVYRSEIYFSGAASELHVPNTGPGVYLLKLIDGKNRQFVLRFVIQ